MRTAPIVCPEESPLVRPQAHTPCPGWSLTRRLRRGRWGCRPEGGSTFFRSERKYQRKHAARRLQRRPARCASRASVCGSRTVGCPNLFGHPIPALRPEQSDHVPWADCLRAVLDLGSLRSPAGKSPLLPILRRGSQCRAQWSWPAFAYGRSALVLAFFRRQNGRAFFPPLPIAALLRRRLGGDEGRIARVGMLPRCPADFASQKADRVSKSRWPLVRAGGPVARRRSVQANWQGIAPDPRAVAPVVPRR